MFGFRIVCTENIFFTSYRYQTLNETTTSYDLLQISPIVPPQYRLLMYLAPCIIPFMLNAIRLWWTTQGLWKYFMTYPQFLISPCFTPFMFEGYQSTHQGELQKIKIWKLGSIINAIYIGCIPQCILCVTDYYKGVHQWEFGKYGPALEERPGVSYENNDALIKHPYGNTIFSITTGTFFLMLIVFFFGSQNIFKERGIHCRCLNILCCPCPGPCIRLTKSNFDPSSSDRTSAKQPADEDIEKHVPSEKPADDVEQPHTEIYLYRRKFICVEETKSFLLGQSSKPSEDFKSSVTIIFIIEFISICKIISYKSKYQLLFFIRI